MKLSRASRDSLNIETVIHTVRGEKVILDVDLARIYGVTTKRLNEQIKRNARRFPADFAFRVGKAELELLTEQITNSDLAGEPVAICDRFSKAPRPTFSTLCIHRARRSNGSQRSKQPASN